MQQHEVRQTLTALLKQVKAESSASQPESQPQLSEAVIQGLSVLYPTVLMSALHILDNGKITKFVCQESRREFFRVQYSPSQTGTNDEYGGSRGQHSERTASGDEYYDIIGDFCCCRFFSQQVLSPNGNAFLCKHVLAAHLAEALSERHDDKLLLKEIADIDFSPLMLSSRKHLAKF